MLPESGQWVDSVISPLVDSYSSVSTARTRSGCGCGALHWIIGNFKLLLVPPQSETLSRYLVKTCKTEIRRVTAPDDAPNRHARARRLWRKEARKEGRGLLSATQNQNDWRHDNLIDKVTNKFDSFIQVLRRNYSWAAHYFVMQTHTHDSIRFNSNSKWHLNKPTDQMTKTVARIPNCSKPFFLRLDHRQACRRISRFRM